ncbi:MBL fold metallo-hydrolase [Aureivirga sp. CE67]|uniref:MBL fold metallo-hydrolase n=1 Tax=Aureivirga sp. CE67 TaxID=1788983 RepID=UPI0018CBDC70|nr:MBL fold metallo-hydrolase [Aureivirga sp. CE67]
MKIQLETKDIIIFESSLYRTTSTLIDSDETIFLVDPNYLPEEINFIHKKVEERRGGKKLVILITHADYDHIVGVNAFNYDELITTEAFLTKRNIKKALYDLEAFEQSFYIQRNYELSYPVPSNLIKENEQIFDFKSSKINGLLTPGHTIDSGAFLLKSFKVLITGDYLSNIEIPVIDDNLEDYKKSMSLFEMIIGNEDLNYIIVGHGDYSTSKEEILERIKLQNEYLEMLEQNVYHGKNFDLKFLEKFPNPIAMRDIHLGNIKNLKR